MFKVSFFLQDPETKNLELFDNQNFFDDLQMAQKFADSNDLPYHIIDLDTLATVGFDWQWFLHSANINYNVELFDVRDIKAWLAKERAKRDVEKENQLQEKLQKELKELLDKLGE